MVPPRSTVVHLHDWVRSKAAHKKGYSLPKMQKSLLEDDEQTNRLDG